VTYAPRVLPTALAIAGLDPSGGAGLAADLRSFAAAGVWGAAVCAALTVQSTRGVRAVRAVPAQLVLDQAREVLADARVRALKTGALGSAANARAVVALIGEHPEVPVVVDPVMMPSRRAGAGAALNGRAMAPLRALAAAATLVTPNLAEAAALLGAPVSDREAPDAASALVGLGAWAALVKGGHGSGAESVDWLATRREVVRIARPRRKTPPLHGTGCTLASLIAGWLAARPGGGAPSVDEIVEAVQWVRERLDQALASPLVVGGGLSVLDVGGLARSSTSGAARDGERE
jgi:hydroxymethylpyrimidine/phosphomethylpyrimidine kinase